MPRLTFDGGTLRLEDIDADALPPPFQWDDRVGCGRAPANCYAQIAGPALEDNAKAWKRLDDLRHLSARRARPYQEEAVAAWKAARWQGVVVLPTGSGKSYVAERIIAETRRTTLVVVPTLDLLSQWYGGLRAAFGDRVGLVGGGSHELRDLTVTTYDSAAIYLDRYGDRFGLIVWDEVHHLPAPAYTRAARCAMAPLRLGLTATLERPDGSHAVLDELVGPVVYRKEIPELAGDFLAEYRTEVITVRMSPEEQASYDAFRAQYKEFCEQENLRIRSPQDWQRFIQVSARSKSGRAAFKAYLASRRIMHGGERKLDLVRELVAEEWGRRTILFTNDNATAYRLSRALLVPCITHHTETRERRAWIDAFAAGEVTVIATSRVLNEGVDIPEAEVAIVVSGTSTTREAVQRLGRILRPGVGKAAVLYELVAEGTGEERASERRRDHDAYR
jgi:superfamily II DNA or RNA helicase